MVFDDTISSFTYYVAGKQVEVWLKVTETSEIVHLYDTDPLQCTFGLANPAYALSFESYCSELAPMEILREMLIDSGANTDPEVDPEPVTGPDSVADQELIDQEPIDQEPIGQDPIDQEPIGQDPINQEPIDQEPIDQEPIDQELIDQEPIDQELIDREPVNQDLTTDSEPNKSDSNSGIDNSSDQS